MPDPSVITDPAGLPSAGAHDLETCIASVYLARLDGLFDREDLGLREGSFVARIGKAAFWTCALCKKDQSRYSAAMRFYLQSLFPPGDAKDVRDYYRIWGQSFYAARDDADSARDMLLLFLDQNLRQLKRLFILDQPHNRNLAPDAQALQRCFDKPANAMLFVGDRFARWVLDDWLPFHLRHACCREYSAEGAAPAQACAHLMVAGSSNMCN